MYIVGSVGLIAILLSLVRFGLVRVFFAGYSESYFSDLGTFKCEHLGVTAYLLHDLKAWLFCFPMTSEKRPAQHLLHGAYP